MDLTIFLPALAKYGLGTILALYLVYMLANSLPQIQAQNGMILQQHQVMQQNIMELKQTDEVNNTNVQRIMRATCLILAKNQLQILSCNQ